MSVRLQLMQINDLVIACRNQTLAELLAMFQLRYIHKHSNLPTLPAKSLTLSSTLATFFVSSSNKSFNLFEGLICLRSLKYQFKILKKLIGLNAITKNTLFPIDTLFSPINPLFEFCNFPVFLCRAFSSRLGLLNYCVW